jgi:hypothetical protein
MEGQKSKKIDHGPLDLQGQSRGSLCCGAGYGWFFPEKDARACIPRRAGVLIGSLFLLCAGEGNHLQNCLQNELETRLALVRQSRVTSGSPVNGWDRGHYAN